MEFKDYQQPVIKLELFIDEDSRTLHILDESQEPHVFLTWFNESIQSRILNRLGEQDEPEQWTWLCYNQDGFLTEYHFGFRHIPFDVYTLHEPFARKMRHRLLNWIGGNVVLTNLGGNTDDTD